MKLSLKAHKLSPSPTLKMAALANELKAQGRPVINLTVGEPDWFTFDAAKKGGVAAIQENFTKYTPAAGLPALREKVAQHISQEFKVDYSASSIVIGSGAKFLIYTAFQMLLDAEDEVLIPSPYWVSYPTMVDMAQGRYRIIETTPEQGFKLTAETLKAAIQPQSKILVLCSPNNPTGLSYTREELVALVDVLKEHPQLIVLSDDIYNRLTLTDDNVAPHLLHVAPELKERLISIGGASKSFAMTGWRIGWMAGPEIFTKKAADYLSQTTSNASSISQKALLAVLGNFENELIRAKTTLKNRQIEMDQWLRQYHIPFFKPTGAFYYFIDIRSFLNKKRPDSLAFCQQLLESYFVATVAGSDFGAEGWLRISFASSTPELEEGLRRMDLFIRNQPFTAL